MSERPVMHDARRQAECREPARLALRLCVLGLCFGSLALVACSNPRPQKRTASPSVEETQPGTLAFDEWTKGSLHCAVQQCEVEYTLHVGEPGRVRAEVYAPLDPGGPDFGLTAVDETGDEIARPLDDSARPRRIVFEAVVGTYGLRVSSRGQNENLLRYEVVAFLTPGKARGRRIAPAIVQPGEPAPRPGPTASEPPPPNPTAATSNDVFVRAEVLDVESEAGGARFVLLDKGVPHGLREQMRGALIDGGKPIGRFVIIEVYEDGCRARIEGGLDREVGIDTVAEIYR